MTSHRRFRLFCFALLAALLGGLISSPAMLAAQKPYKVLNTWKVGGDGGWDYLHADPAAHRLYIAHGTHLDALDLRTGKLVGSIPNLHGMHGIALDTDGEFGYITDGGVNAVVAFDRATLAVVAIIPAGNHPDGIVFEPVTHTVWAFNGHSRNVTVIDAATRKVVATIALPGKPEFPVADGQGTVFDNIEDKSEIVRLDAKTLKLTATWPLTGCEGPSGLAIDRAGRRLFSVCHNKTMAVVDANTGKVLATPTIGEGPDAARYSATRKLAFASCGEGVLSVVDAAAPGYPTIETLPTQRGARTMAYDPTTDRIYLADAQFGERPAPTATHPHPWPSIVPGSFEVLVVGR